MESVIADLKQDLLSNTLKTLEYQDKDKTTLLISIIKKYFDHLSVSLTKPNLTYLTLFNYDQNNLGLYGHFLVEYLRNTKTTFGNIEHNVRLVELYLKWIPVDLFTLREKLLAIRRVQLNSVNDSISQVSSIDRTIVTCRTVDTRYVSAKIDRMYSTKSQLDFLLDAIRQSTETQTNLYQLLTVLNESLSSSELYSLSSKLLSYGSQSNGLAIWNSDLDVVLKFEATKLELLDFDTSMLALQVVRGILQHKLGLNIADQFMIASRRCPLIKLDFSKCLPGQFGFGSGLKCDISIRSLAGVRNSKFLHFLTQYDHRFFEMTMLIRYWAKNRVALIGPGGISSYGLTLMIVFFLQNTDPVVLPSMEQFIELYNKNCPEQQISEKDCDFCDNVDMFAKSLNTKSTGELVVEFFKYYHNFDSRAYSLRIRTGKLVDKYTMYRQNRCNSPDTSLYFCETYMAIEDPFDRTNNAGTGFSAAVFQKWKSQIGSLVSHATNKITNENFVQVLCKNRNSKAKSLGELVAPKHHHYEDDRCAIDFLDSD